MSERLELALAFAKTLRELLGPEIVAELVRLNAQPGRGNECASHDFCDANMVMAHAFQRALGRAPLMPGDVEEGAHSDQELERDTNLWNAAWSTAKSGDFSYVKIMAAAADVPDSIGQCVSTAWEEVLGTDFLLKPAGGPGGQAIIAYMQTQEGRLVQLFDAESTDNMQAFATSVKNECARLEREAGAVNVAKPRRARP
ncbi:hypothetical protein ABIC83_002450 [Roseateles asaccharophilus]|uniref:hypothetical protein n=1 Tax=Roseateles asaccharophilus TaxID=582607 RepID=UPI003838A9EE